MHDLSSHRGNKEAVLREGMVITVEPGIYLRKKTKSYPVCGIRIEDDVLVTKRGCEVLSAEIPKEIEDLEAWMQTAGG